LHVHAESNRPQKRCLNQTDRDITNWFVFLLTIRRYAAIIYQQQVQVKGVEMDVIFITQISGHEFQGAAQAGWGANAG